MAWHGLPPGTPFHGNRCHLRTAYLFYVMSLYGNSVVNRQLLRRMGEVKDKICATMNARIA